MPLIQWRSKEARLLFHAQRAYDGGRTSFVQPYIDARNTYVVKGMQILAGQKSQASRLTTMDLYDPLQPLADMRRAPPIR